MINYNVVPDSQRCPMTKEYMQDNNITEEQARKWCANGCSVDCKNLLSEHLERRKAK